MKKLLAFVLLLCMLAPMAAVAEEKLPRVQFPSENYVAYLDYEFYLQIDVKTSGSLKSPKTYELRDETGRVWATKEVKSGWSQYSYKIMLDESHNGGHTLSIWCGDTQVSKNTAYVAVTDKHKKAIQHVDITEPYMSLSFDCAFYDDQTDALLAILDELNIKATFFMTGGFVKNFTESAEKIRDAGHEIASHSQWHHHLLEDSLSQRFAEVRNGAATIRNMLGVNPRLFRPPYGEFNVTVSAPARAEGMEVCLWTIDSHDWDTAYNAEKVYKRVTKDVTPGTIILFHLDGYSTLEVVPKAVQYYREELGLEFVPITELMAMGGLELPDCPYEDDTAQAE